MWVVKKVTLFDKNFVGALEEIQEVLSIDCYMWDPALDMCDGTEEEDSHDTSAHSPTATTPTWLTERWSAETSRMMLELEPESVGEAMEGEETPCKYHLLWRSTARCPPPAESQCLSPSTSFKLDFKKAKIHIDG